MLEPEPVWHPDQHIERVYRRGRQLRRRRRAVLAAAPAALVVLGVFAVGGEVSHSARPVSVADGGSAHIPAGSATDGGAESSGPTPKGSPRGQRDPAAGGDAGSAAAPAPGSAPTASPSAGGAVASPGSSQTAGQPSPSPSSSHQPNSSPASGPQPNTAAPTASTSACPASALDYSTVTDRSSYTRGQPVTISLVVHNHSNRPCDGPGPCGVGPWASVQTTSGATVWQSHPIAVACSNPPPAPPRLAPGQSVTYQAGTWNQVVCASSSSSCSSQAAPGTYRAIAHRGNVNAAATRFTIS